MKQTLRNLLLIACATLSLGACSRFDLSLPEGPQGKQGTAGASAYDIWKGEVLSRKIPWTSGMTLSDFFRYLKGRDGKDGKNGINGKDGRTGSDGRPSPPGTAGDTVVVVIGKPNVIAQYSIQSQSEYILPEGVRYKVYWEDGELAPHAVVKGLPGMDAEKTFTADEKGEFVIPMADLPFADEISFGRAESVSYKGKTARSANNTYVPNKFLYEFEVNNRMMFLYADVMQGSFNLRVKRAPSKPWQSMPLYFQKAETKVHAYRISDPNNPHSFVLNDKGEKIKELWRMDYHQSYVVPSRAVIRSKRAPTTAKSFWDGKKRYYLCDFNFGSFPGLIREALIIEVPPIQYAPRLKSIHLKTKRQTEGGVTYFESVSGELDNSDIDFSNLYSVYNRTFSRFSTGQRILFTPLTPEEVARYKVYVRFRYNAGGVSHDVLSSPKHPSFSDLSYKAVLPYIGSYVHIDFDWSSTSGQAHNVSWLPDRTGGTLKYAPNGKDFLVTFDSKQYPNLQPITVTYEE